MCLLSHIVSGQKGKHFPDVQLENVDGKTYNSNVLFGKGYVLIGIGTSQKAEEDLRTWQEPVYNKYIAKTGLMDGMYDVQVWFIPLFTGANQVSKPKVIKKLKENNEPMVENHLLIYSGSKDPFDSFGVVEKREPYFMLVNSDGLVVWVAQGSFQQKYIDQIQDILSTD